MAIASSLGDRALEDQIGLLDRLGRSVRDLIEFVGALREREINFRTLDGNAFDTGTAHGQFFFTMMAAPAEMERGLIRERTTAGLAAARARGRLGGRRPKLGISQLAHARRLLEERSTSVAGGNLRR